MTKDPSSDVLDPELWQHVKAAISAVNSKIREHRASGAWTPSTLLPTMSSFDSGWPNISIEGPGRSEETPDYSRLFGVRPEGGRPFAYSDVPELVGAIDYIVGRPDLLEKLRFIPTGAQMAEEAELDFARYEAADLVLSVADRAWSLGQPDDESTLLVAYQYRERSIVAPELTADVVVPLILTNLDLVDPLELDEGLCLEKLEEPFQLASARISATIESVPTVVSNAATHAIVISGAKIDNSTRVERVWRGGSAQVDLTKVDAAIECLRIITEVPTGYGQVLLRPLDWADRWFHSLPPVQALGTYRRYPASFDNYGWLQVGKKVTAAQLSDLAKVHKSVQSAGKATLLAIRRLSLAELRDNEDDKLVDACIGIEALLSNESLEIAHKIATRGAAALATQQVNPLDAHTTFRMLKKVYGRRSDLVHGTSNEKNAFFKSGPDGKPVATSRLAPLLLRKLLLSQLLAETPWKIEDLDSILMTSLNRRTVKAPTGEAEEGDN